jgi:peptide chain release factor 1
VSNSVVIEIRSASGGDEAKDFVSILTRMYTRYAAKVGWTVSALDVADSMTTFMVEGDGLDRLQGETGVHCIQRIPPNRRNSGKVHTSTATVAILKAVPETIALYSESEFRVETLRGTGAGGQNRNKVESAVRIVHLPTGLSAICRDERSQSQNRERAMAVLRARVDAHLNGKLADSVDRMRGNQILGGFRAERFRTYDIPEDRLIDRRSGIRVQNLKRIFNGDLDAILQ